MSSTFFQNVELMRKLLASRKSLAEQHAAIRPLLADPDVAREFWEHLNDPRWIDLLKGDGFFAQPLEPETRDGKWIRFPTWPASRFLARVASAEPARVAEIFAAMNTRNCSVVADMITAALAMPAQNALALVPAIAGASKGGTLWMAFEDAAGVCALLANGGLVEPALGLADALYSPRAESTESNPGSREDLWYFKGLATLVPALTRTAPRPFVERMCSWLDTSIKGKRFEFVDPTEDLSYSWRPAIEEHEQNRDSDFAGNLAGVLRSSLDLCRSDGLLSLGDCLAALGRHSYVIFRRLELYLVAQSAEQDETLARQWILDRTFFDDIRMRHEYAGLVGARLNLLSFTERELWYGWIESGPDMSDYDDSFREGMNREPTDKDRQARIDYWKFERFHWARAHLSGEREAFYHQMLQQQGEPETADLPYRVSTSWGDESPIGVDALIGKPLSEVVAIVSSWKPEEDKRHWGPNAGGLASTFAKYLETNASEYSKFSHLMSQAPSIFVRSFISQMVEGVKKGEAIDIPSVIGLCQWVVALPLQELPEPAGETGAQMIPEGQWTRDSVVNFVEQVCVAMADSRPKYAEAGLREPLWSLLEQLCEDRTRRPTVRPQEGTDPRLIDYLQFGINSSRGRAVQAALEYARWIANHRKTIDGSREVVPGGFEAMPEVRRMLVWQMQPEHRSVDAMSVIGSRIGLLLWIDREWLSRSASDLFDLNSIERESGSTAGWAAWNAFLIWVRPHIEFYRVFKAQFVYALKQSMMIVGEFKDAERNAMLRIGEHLVLLYGRGDISLEDDDGIVRRFIEDAPSSLRRHAIGFVGRSISGKERLPPEVVARFTQLWDLYWNSRGPTDASEHPEDWLFGQWFASGQFSVEWSLSRLRQFNEVVPVPEPDHAVADRLAEIADQNVPVAVAILDRMIRDDREGWHIQSFLKPANTILSLGIAAGGETSELAIGIIDFLGRRGFMDFGDLLKKK